MLLHTFDFLLAYLLVNCDVSRLGLVKNMIQIIIHGRNLVKCGGTAWCETNIVIGPMQKWRFIYTDFHSYF